MRVDYKYIEEAGKRTRYPWKTMKVGDYFVIEPQNKKGHNHVRQLVFAANIREQPLKFKHRRAGFEDDVLENSVIIERVE